VSVGVEKNSNFGNFYLENYNFMRIFSVVPEIYLFQNIFTNFKFFKTNYLRNYCEYLHEILHFNRVYDADSESEKRFSKFPILFEIKIPKIQIFLNSHTSWRPNYYVNVPQFFVYSSLVISLLMSLKFHFVGKKSLHEKRTELWRDTMQQR
jgi:hypothetical protein